MSPRVLWSLLRETVKEWSEDKVPRLGAALAYYTVFSLAPLLIIAIGIASLVFSRSAVESQILGQMRALVGEQGAELVGTMIQSVSQPRQGALATVVGVGTLIFGALGAFGQLQDALNTIWEVQPRPGRGLKGILRDRLAAFGLVLAVGFLLLVSLVLSAGLAALGTFIQSLTGAAELLMQVVNFVISFGVVTLLFALMFKFLPDAKIRWRDVWIGAAITALLFTIGRTLIGLYLGRGSVTSAYGAAGSLVVLLLWIYYSTQILFFGAEFTQVYANRFGSRVQPAANAVPVTEAARANQGMPRQAPAAGGRAAVPVTGAAGIAVVADSRAPLAPAIGAGSGIEPWTASSGATQRRQVTAATVLSFAAGLGAGVLVALEALRGPAREEP